MRRDFPFVQRQKFLPVGRWHLLSGIFFSPSGKKFSCSGKTFPEQDFPFALRDFLFVQRQKFLPAGRWHSLSGIFFFPSGKNFSCLGKNFSCVGKNFSCLGKNFFRAGFPFPAPGFPFCAAAKVFVRRAMASAERNFLFFIGEKVSCVGKNFCRSILARWGGLCLRCRNNGIRCAGLWLSGRDCDRTLEVEGRDRINIEAGPASRFPGRLATARTGGGPASFVYLVIPR